VHGTSTSHTRARCEGLHNPCTNRYGLGNSPAGPMPWLPPQLTGMGSRDPPELPLRLQANVHVQGVLRCCPWGRCHCIWLDRSRICLNLPVNHFCLQIILRDMQGLAKMAGGVLDLYRPPWRTWRVSFF